MSKPITPTLHGALDYATSVATAAAPTALNLPAPAATAAYALAGTYATLSAITDYPPSVARLVPFRAHGALEAASVPALLALPYVLGVGEHKPSRYFFWSLAAVTFVVYTLTDWDKRE